MTGAGSSRVSTDVTAINQMIARLFDVLFYATNDYEIWYVLNAQEYRDRFAPTMLTHSGYLVAAKRAHHAACIVGVCSLYETRSDTFNVPTLLKAIGKLPQVSKAVHDELERRQLVARKIWLKVSQIRNNVFGHKSSKLTTAQVYQRAGLTADELKDIIGQTSELLNFAATHVDGTGYYIPTHGTESAVQLLEALQAVLAPAQN